MRSIVAARILVLADQFLLLGVDRDHRLASGLKRRGLRVDMLELRVPIRMTAAFLGLAIDLTAVAEAFEQLRNPARRHPVSDIAKCERQFGVALGHPQEWSHGIAERHRFEQFQKVLQQRRISLRQRGRPPPARRILGAAFDVSRSFKPRSIVLRAIPVARVTALTPPYPAVRASAAASKRRPRSSRRAHIAS